MSFYQLMLVLKARYKIALSTILIVVAIALAISLYMDKSYTATATIVVNYKGADPVTGIPLPAQLMPGYMATQVDIISSQNVAKKVVNNLKLADSQNVVKSFQDATEGRGSIEDWLSGLLVKKLNVQPSKESSIINLNFSGASPEFAAVIANAFAEAYIQTSIELKVDPSKKAAIYFTEQVQELRDNLAAAQQKLSDYQQEKGIVSVDERLDIERARLSDLSSQLVAAQSQTMEALSRQRNASGVGALDSPDIAANPVIQTLKTEIARADSKFADISQKFDKNHPLYQGAKAEIENLRSELDRQIQAVSVNVAGTYKIFQQREAETRVALNTQKLKVLELNKDRDAFTVLTKEVENAQRAYDLATQRFTQTNMEGQSNQSDAAILTPAIPPLEPSSPKIVLNTLISIFVGLFLGIAMVFLVEFIDRRVRTPQELVEVLGVPVLGVIPKDKTRKLLAWSTKPKLKAY